MSNSDTIPHLDHSAEHLTDLIYELFNRSTQGRTRAFIPAIDHLFEQHATTLAGTPVSENWTSSFRHRLLSFPPLPPPGE
jgi:hypothetical protein